MWFKKFCCKFLGIHSWSKWFKNHSIPVFDDYDYRKEKPIGERITSERVCSECNQSDYMRKTIWW